MCLLTFIPSYVMPDMEKFRIAAISNPDGFGFAINTGKKIVTGHGMDFNKVAEKFTELRATHQGPATFHFRWATHGSETVDNCHPFFLGEDKSSVVAHNGILPVAIPKGDTRSDTKVFAEDIMPAVGGITSLDDNDYFNQLSEWAKGSKLVFLTTHDDAKYDFYILNEQDGHWADDMWWSNSSYKTVPYRSYNYGSMWNDWDYGYESTYSNTTRWDQKVSEDYDDEYDLKLDAIFEQFNVFMTDLGPDTCLLECYTCAHSDVISSEKIVTQCPACNACLYCGAHHDCGCWDDLYQSFDVEAHNSELPVLQTTHPSYY
jgi:hypothetical protein